MSYHATGRFQCDGCKVSISDEIVIEADVLEPVLPRAWLRLETTRHLDDLDIRSIKHFCSTCAPLVESYLAGRRTEAAR
jgi:hypothetical protein